MTLARRTGLLKRVGDFERVARDLSGSLFWGVSFWRGVGVGGLVVAGFTVEGLGGSCLVGVTIIMELGRVVGAEAGGGLFAWDDCGTPESRVSRTGVYGIPI